MSEFSERLSKIKAALETAEDDEKQSIVPALYNLAADTWSGWEDAEIVPASDRDIGIEAARLNIQLAAEFDFPPGRRKNGYWILGAHLLEAGSYVDAESAFQASHELTLQTTDEAAQVMTEGWVLTCQLIRGEANQDALDEIKARLMTLGEDGEFYAAQFEPAIKKFS